MFSLFTLGVRVIECPDFPDREAKHYSLGLQIYKIILFGEQQISQQFILLCAYSTIIKMSADLVVCAVLWVSAVSKKINELRSDLECEGGLLIEGPAG